MPSAEHRRVLVWQRGEALLALPIEDVVEVAVVSDSGAVPTRRGDLRLARPVVLEGGRARRAIVVRHGADLAALPADTVDGVAEASPARVADPPGWIRRAGAPHVRGILRLGNDRLAALLDLDALLE